MPSSPSNHAGFPSRSSHSIKTRRASSSESKRPMWKRRFLRKVSSSHPVRLWGRRKCSTAMGKTVSHLAYSQRSARALSSLVCAVVVCVVWIVAVIVLVVGIVADIVANSASATASDSDSATVVVVVVAVFVFVAAAVAAAVADPASIGNGTFPSPSLALSLRLLHRIGANTPAHTVATFARQTSVIFPHACLASQNLTAERSNRNVSRNDSGIDSGNTRASSAAMAICASPASCPSASP
mmetsp:Transcript_2352/g.5212  ORF Transcript_2352/g.5212 Transcript_2352/m.5212 type:complete len:240 (+) Transcript_2352:249-968(+)